MLRNKGTIGKAIKVLAILTLLVFSYTIVSASLNFGETTTVDLTGLLQTLFTYLIAVVLAILVLVYFWSYPGLRWLKYFSTLLVVIYGYSIFSLPFNVGDTIDWNPGYFVFALFIFSLGLILSIWTMTYFKKID